MSTPETPREAYARGFADGARAFRASAADNLHALFLQYIEGREYYEDIPFWRDGHAANYVRNLPIPGC